MIESKFALTNVTSSRSHRLALGRFVAAIATFGVPALAYAQTVTGGASPQTMINNVCTFILGPFGETIAVLGIIGIGFLFMFGRASLGIIAGIIGGIVIMFGASYLGSTLTGGG
ncbi:pilin major subunit VirB2 [Acidocella facilis]|uniref:pilin major subunit VirB2 n=1 Tax=Acidocella facilis TaxID=525 RepID=UPI001F22D79C|nr:pilin major subunit VirB2 [Acidocella facilis]